jgi:energy-coupling factor transporter ATP-binding protein EcfA2
MRSAADPTIDSIAADRWSTDAAVEMFEVTQITQGRTTLHDVSFSVAPGEVVAIVGGSGAGKTTLLETMVGIRPPAVGEVRIAGAHGRSDVGYAPGRHHPPGPAVGTDAPVRSSAPAPREHGAGHGGPDGRRGARRARPRRARDRARRVAVRRVPQPSVSNQPDPPDGHDPLAPSRAGPFRQWAVLTRRSADRLIRNRLTLAVLVGSPALVITMMAVLFRPGAFDAAATSPGEATQTVFWLAFAGFFFGLPYGLLQIVGEMAILRRERLAGLAQATAALPMLCCPQVCSRERSSRCPTWRAPAR